MISSVFQLTVKVPNPPHQIQIMVRPPLDSHRFAPRLTRLQVSPQEQVQDIRQSVIELPGTFQYSCFHLEHNGSRINDYVELSEVPAIGPSSELLLVEDPYTEKEARIHLLRTRELVGVASARLDPVGGIAAGMALFGAVDVTRGGAPHPLSDYQFDAPASLDQFLPPASLAPSSAAASPPPKCVKGLFLSPWNPPPYHLRQRGHLLYIQAATLEGETVHITSHVSGFYVNRSSTSKFDPAPRSPTLHAHSLVTLLGRISPGSDSGFLALQQHSAAQDPLITFAPTNAIPAAPWLVPGPDAQHRAHTADLARPQEQFLLAGAEGIDSLRDFNEEFQSTRELPRDSVQDRVFRERLLSKLFADYTDAAVRGAVLIARGELAPLNPTEGRDAQIYVYNNIFFSHGADGVGTFTADGGDEAARVTTGKDVVGVKAVNTLDIPGLQTPGTVVVDYLGRRLVAQSIVPGIFRQREEGHSQIDYGSVEGKDVVATNDDFVPLFDRMSRAMHVKPHHVWDKEGCRHRLVTSVETKGLLGTDGRKYVLDLYRITPLDVVFLEKHWKGVSDDSGYPHRMAVLRQELVDSFWKFKMREFVSKEIASRKQARGKAEQEAAESAESKQDQVILSLLPLNEPGRVVVREIGKLTFFFVRRRLQRRKRKLRTIAST